MVEQFAPILQNWGTVVVVKQRLHRVVLPREGALGQSRNAVGPLSQDGPVPGDEVFLEGGRDARLPYWWRFRDPLGGIIIADEDARGTRT